MTEVVETPGDLPLPDEVAITAKAEADASAKAQQATGEPDKPAEADDKADAATAPDAQGDGADGADAAAEPTDGQDEGDASTSSAPKGKPKGGFQRRIDELTRRANAAERDRERLLALLEKQGGQTPAQPAPPQDTPPREDQFQDYNEYLVAKAKYEAKQEFRQEQEAERQRQAQDAERRGAEERARQWDERVSKARDQYEDFDAVALSPAVPINQHMSEVISASDKGPDIAYYLGSHLDEARRIAQMPPLAAARELGLIEAKLSLPKPRTTTNAPPPINPVGGSDIPVRDPRKMTMEEYRAAREKGIIR